MCGSVVVLVVRGDEWKMILSIAICHPHESTAWAACEVGDLWQANKRKATGLKGEFLGGVLRVLGCFAGTLGYIDHHPPSPPLVTHHSLLCGYKCCVTMPPAGCTITTREHGDITNDKI